jgi:hypothetical protein
MTILKLLIATAMLATPALARETYLAKRHAAAEANASSTREIGGHVCIPAPRVGAFATAPWNANNLPCEPDSY